VKLDNLLLIGGAGLLLYSMRKDIFPSIGGEAPGITTTTAPLFPSSDGFYDAGQSTIPTPQQAPQSYLNAPQILSLVEKAPTTQITFTPVASTTSGAVPGTTETTISNVRLTPSGITPDSNFKVMTTSLGSVKEQFSSKGFDAFGTTMPTGSKNAATPTTTSSGAPIPVVENGVVNYYSPKAFAMTYGAKK
jgi:hypothetical protein